MNMALIITILGVVVLVTSVTLNIYLCTVITKASKVVEAHKRVEAIRANCLAHVLDFKQTLVFIKMMEEVMKLIQQNGLDVDDIDYKILRKTVTQNFDEVLDELHNMVKESE